MTAVTLELKKGAVLPQRKTDLRSLGISGNQIELE